MALWRFYLNYIRRVNPINVTMPEQSATSRAVITKGFEFALNHVGQDRSAGELWHDYIKFLKEGQVSSERSLGATAVLTLLRRAIEANGKTSSAWTRFAKRSSAPSASRWRT